MVKRKAPHSQQKGNSKKPKNKSQITKGKQNSNKPIKNNRHPKKNVPIESTELPDVAPEEVDDEISPEAMKFLLDMDMNAISESRHSLKEKHAQEKKIINRENATHRKQEPGEEDDEGEAWSDLDSDDFAMNSDADVDDDDDLSVMESGSDIDSDVDIDSGSEIDSDADSNVDSQSDISSNVDIDSDIESENSSDLEREYEERIRKQPKKPVESESLPIIVDGKAVKDQSRPKIQEKPTNEEDDESEDDADADSKENQKTSIPPRVSDPLGQRFGRKSIYAIFDHFDKRTRLAVAQKEIADLGREAESLAENEGGLNVLRRLHALTQKKLEPPGEENKKIPVDPEIQIMALLSLTTVWADILPSYRIRDLSETEKNVRVSQAVMRQREWEQGILNLYGKTMKYCAHLAKNRSSTGIESKLRQVAVHCMCRMIEEKPYFNFAVDILESIIRILGSRDWNDSCDRCLNAVKHVLENDVASNALISMHVVRLVARLIRARDFKIHPGVLSVLLFLRLSDELQNVRASTEHADKKKSSSAEALAAKIKDKKSPKNRKSAFWSQQDAKASKKARAAQKEQLSIQKEIEEAEGAIDEHEREATQTETLKLLFGLYFRILKLEEVSVLLPEALEGLARFAHLVNVDFFRDLLLALRETMNSTTNVRCKLLCLVTAFELLRGQGSSLALDLSDFISDLYQLMLELSLSSTFDAEVPTPVKGKKLPTEADLLFRALASIFHNPHARQSPIRSMSFSKRLLTCSLHWAEKNQARALLFVRSMALREPRLEGMIDPEDHTVNGKYLPYADQPDRAHPESTSWWELELLAKSSNPEVQREARGLFKLDK